MQTDPARVTEALVAIAIAEVSIYAVVHIEFRKFIAALNRGHAQRVTRSVIAHCKQKGGQLCCVWERKAGGGRCLARSVMSTDVLTSLIMCITVLP